MVYSSPVNTKFWISASKYLGVLFVYSLYRFAGRIARDYLTLLGFGHPTIACRMQDYLRLPSWSGRFSMAGRSMLLIVASLREGVLGPRSLILQFLCASC